MALKGASGLATRRGAEERLGALHLLIPTRLSVFLLGRMSKLVLDEATHLLGRVRPQRRELLNRVVATHDCCNLLQQPRCISLHAKQTTAALLRYVGLARMELAIRVLSCGMQTQLVPLHSFVASEFEELLCAQRAAHIARVVGLLVVVGHGPHLLALAIQGGALQVHDGRSARLVLGR